MKGSIFFSRIEKIVSYPELFLALRFVIIIFQSGSATYENLKVSINICMHIFIMTIATLDSKFGSHFSTNLVKIFIEHISNSFMVMNFGIIMIQH